MDQFKPNQSQFPKRPKMNLNFYPTRDYENKSDWTLGENKPNQTQTNPIGLLSSVLEFTPGAGFSVSLPGVLRPLFPEEAVFSFDLAARPVILNTNIRQLRRPMEREQFEQFKARKETYHVY